MWMSLRVKKLQKMEFLSRSGIVTSTGLAENQLPVENTIEGMYRKQQTHFCPHSILLKPRGEGLRGTGFLLASRTGRSPTQV